MIYTASIMLRAVRKIALWLVWHKCEVSFLLYSLGVNLNFISLFCISYFDE